LGDWHRQFGDIDEAEKLLLEASNLGHTWSGLQLGIIYCEKNNSVRACEIWTIAAEDGDVLAIKYLAEFYEEVEEFESAQHWFEKMAQNDSFYGYDHLGDFYNRLGDYKKAEECWSTSADLDNLYSCISLAKLNLTLGKEIDAEKWFLRASEIDFEQIIDQIIKSYREFNLQEQADFWDSKKQITQLSSGTKRD
jgi:tetratricopeptide (TPR) repeat protein